MVDLECLQITFKAHVLGIHYPRNGAIMLRSVEGYNDPSYLNRGDVSSIDGRFGCDAVSMIFFNSRDAILADTRKVLEHIVVFSWTGMQSWRCLRE